MRGARGFGVTTGQTPRSYASGIPRLAMYGQGITTLHSHRNLAGRGRAAGRVIHRRLQEGIEPDRSGGPARQEPPPCLRAGCALLPYARDRTCGEPSWQVLRCLSPRRRAWDVPKNKCDLSRGRRFCQWAVHWRSSQRIPGF